MHFRIRELRSLVRDSLIAESDDPSLRKKSGKYALMYIDALGSELTTKDMDRVKKFLLHNGWNENDLIDIDVAIAVSDGDRYIDAPDAMNDLRALLSEARGNRYPSQFVTSKGRSTGYGSSKHVKELEDTLEKLVAARSRQRRGSAAKTDMTRAIGRLRSELAKVKRFAETQKK